MQQLLGKLFWISRCVRFSRPFMGRLLHQLRSMHSLPDHKKAVLSDPCREDIRWWHRYVRRFNGIELIYRDEPLQLDLEQLLDSPALVICGDAQPQGGGAYFAEEYWSRKFPQWLQSLEIPIHLKEFYVILASVWLWGDCLTGKLVYIYCDNDAVVESLEKEKPKDSEMQKLVREFSYQVCIKKFTPVFRKISSKDNWVADFISRCHDTKLIKQFVEVNKLKCRNLVQVPDVYFEMNSNW
jgi:hypothetical protein